MEEYTRERETEQFRQAQAGDRGSLNALMRRHKQLVHAVVRQQWSGGWRYEEVVQEGRIGKRIASLVVYLRTKLRLPVRQIQEYLETQHQLRLSIGEIVELTHTVRRALQPQIDTLLQEVQASPVVHADETGWRENGQNGYIWAFLSPTPDPVYYFVYHQTRAQRIPQGVLGLHLSLHMR